MHMIMLLHGFRNVTQTTGSCESLPAGMMMNLLQSGPGILELRGLILRARRLSLSTRQRCSESCLAFGPATI